MVVSDVIDEIILDIDWLTSQGAIREFYAAKLHIGNNAIKQPRRPVESKVRQIVVAEYYTVPARSCNGCSSEGDLGQFRM